MSLSVLQIFQDQVYDSMSEVLAQQVALFNEATNGAITLQAVPRRGDYADTAFWKLIPNLVRRRDAYGSGAVAAVNLEHLLHTGVKVASGTAPVNIPPSRMRWIQREPEEQGSAIGQQLAIGVFADQLNTALLCLNTAVGVASATNEFDQVAAGASNTLAPSSLVSASGLFGDAMGDIACWVMHSKNLTDYHLNGVTNAERLFTYGTVAVVQDVYGKPMVVTDSASLINTTPTPDQYHVHGIVTGGLRVESQGDYEDNLDTRNEAENITRTYQAEWSNVIHVKGFRYTKAQASPADADLATGANWEQYATSHKDLASVYVKCE